MKPEIYHVRYQGQDYCLTLDQVQTLFIASDWFGSEWIEGRIKIKPATF